MKFEAGQIVEQQYTLSSPSQKNVLSRSWLYIITGVLPRKYQHHPQYYKCYCFKSSAGSIRESEDLHSIVVISEEVLSEV